MRKSCTKSVDEIEPRSERVRILGEIVRYPKRIGFRKISENSERTFLQTLKNSEKVIYNSLLPKTGIFVAKLFKGSSKEIAVLCPTEIYYNYDSGDCNRTNSSIDLALDS